MDGALQHFCGGRTARQPGRLHMPPPRRPGVGLRGAPPRPAQKRPQLPHGAAGGGGGAHATRCNRLGVSGRRERVLSFISLQAVHLCLAILRCVVQRSSPYCVPRESSVHRRAISPRDIALVYPGGVWIVFLFLCCCCYCCCCCRHRISGGRVADSSLQEHAVHVAVPWRDAGGKRRRLPGAGKLASLNSSRQSNGTLCVSGLAGVEPMLSKSDWTRLSP